MFDVYAADRLGFYLKNFPKTANVVLEPADMFVTADRLGTSLL